MKYLKRIKYNSPVVLSFVFASFAVLVLSIVTSGWTDRLFFSVYRSSWLNPLTYIRLFGHVLGHSGWEHYSGNMMMLLLVGPLLEEKYGSFRIGMVMLVTAFVTGLANIILFPYSSLLGASGIVFAFILLSSITSMKDGEIPLTLIIIALIYIGGQVVDGIFVKDNVSNLTHIIGGVIGCVFGSIISQKDQQTSYGGV